MARTPTAPAPPLEILFRDESLVAVHKPAGLLVHRSRLSADREFLLQRLRNQLGCRVFPVHRLDRPTSGVILFGLDPAAAAAMALAFRAGRVHKTYLAVVRGYAPTAGIIDHPLGSLEGGPAQAAISRYRRLALTELPVAVGRYPTARYSLVEARPHTGRRHQLRRHFAHIAHPLIGDTRYGRGEHNRLFRERFGLHRLLLVATEVSLPHPRHGAPVRVRTTCDAELLELFRCLGWTAAVRGAHTRTPAPRSEPQT